MNAVLSKPLLKESANEILNAFILNRQKNDILPTTIDIEKESNSFLLSQKILDHDFGVNAAGNESLLQELVGMLFISIPDQLNLLNAAYKANDWQSIQNIVHKINGGASYCGALRLRDACIHLEDYLKKGEIELKDPLYQQVLTEIDAFQKHYLNTYN